MRHEITMPQLGMAQDSGVIVSWQKKPGDEVKSSDILMEVETDKATMEVEAGHDGFLAEIRAEAGQDVPVGDVVAVIADEITAVKADAKATSPAPQKQGGKTDPGKHPPQAPPEAIRTEPQLTASNTASAAVSDRILASPKARYLAHQQGLDLGQLVRQGVRQPFHVADLGQFRSVTETDRGAATCELAASVKRKRLEKLADWAARESGGAVTRGAIWLSLASGALREGLDGVPGEGIQAEYLRPGDDESNCSAIDADLTGMAHLTPGAASGRCELSIVDLTATKLDGYSLARPGDAVSIVVTNKGKRKLRLVLRFGKDRMPVEKAVALLNGLAGRVAEPLRNLL